MKMTLRYFFIIICLAIFINILQAQHSRKWTNNEGQSFTGSIVDCDGVVAKYKIFGRKNLFELPLSENASSNMLNVYIHFYEKKDGILLDYYELNTIVKLKKNDINLLGWSSSISRFNTNPKFISFVKFN